MFRGQDQQRDWMLTWCKSEVDNQVKDIVTVDPRPIAVVLFSRQSA
jgi:hypothetical protein